MSAEAKVWIPGAAGEWLREVWGEIHGEEFPSLGMRKVGRGSQWLVPATPALLRYCEQEVDLNQLCGGDPGNSQRARLYREVVRRLREALE